jgi:hypothetical protein
MFSYEVFNQYSIINIKNVDNCRLTYKADLVYCSIGHMFAKLWIL